MTPKIEIYRQKIRSFWRFERSFLTILGGRKSHFQDIFVFWKFHPKLLILFATHNWRSPLGSRGSPIPRKCAGFDLFSNLYPPTTFSASDGTPNFGQNQLTAVPQTCFWWILKFNWLVSHRQCPMTRILVCYFFTRQSLVL